MFVQPVWSAVPSVKVLIAKSLQQVVVHGQDLKKIIHTKKQVDQYVGDKIISFKCQLPQLPRHHLFSKSPQLVASLSSPSGLVSWGKQKYQGELQLLTSPHHRSCDLVNSISLENYLTTLLAKEMNGTWPLEALKAQAVAARTYAFERVKKGISLDEKLYHLESSERDQVSGHYYDRTDKTIRAAEETEGVILVTPSGRVAPAFFHSKCGGKTLRPDQVWGGVEEGYRSVECQFCKKTGTKDWRQKIKNEKLSSMLDQVLKKYYLEEKGVGELKLMSDSLENSEVRIYAGDKLHIVKKAYLRNTVGRDLLPSNNFKIEQNENEFHFEGAGYGHGVGLCQLGALELAKRGYNYRQILSFYFPRHKLKKAY